MTETNRARGPVRAALALALAGLLAILTGGILGITGAPAVSADGDECVPEEAWTETTDWVTESPGDGWYVAAEQTVVDLEMQREESDWVTESPGDDWVQFDERTVDGEVLEEGYWQRYSWTGGPHESDDPPAAVPPHDDWQANVKGDPHGVGTEGAYYRSHGNSGKGDWFYLDWVDEVREKVTEYRYYRETPAVTHQEYQFSYDHPAVECPDEPTEEPTDETEPPEVAPSEESEPSAAAGGGPTQGAAPQEAAVEVKGAEATRPNRSAGSTTVPRAVDAGVGELSGSTTAGAWSTGLVGSGVVLLLAAWMTLAGARRREVA